jgi:teichuronic acid biosynthesis glycosyltransferase TuaC
MKVLMVCNHYGSTVKTQLEGLRELGIEIEALEVNRAKYGRFVYFCTFHQVRKHIRNMAPDILHCQYGGILSYIVSFTFPRRRIVVTYCGTDLHGGIRTANVFLNLSKKVGVWCSRFTAKRVAWNITVSENLKACLPPTLSSVTVLPRGVNYALFRPLERTSCLRELQLSPEMRWILFCDANHDPVKRRDLAEKAIALLNTSGEHVKLLELNKVPHSRVPFYLNAAHCLLVTSDKEGSPNIVKEALACNVPVVSVDAGDVVERIRNVKGCYIVERDVATIAKAIQLTLQQERNSASREIVSSEIGNRAICKKISELYINILKARDL